MSHVEGLVLASLSGQVAVVIAPGLTGTAEGFVEWFSPLLEGEAGVDVVVRLQALLPLQRMSAETCAFPCVYTRQTTAA